MIRTLWKIWLVMFVVIILADIPQWVKGPNWVEYATLGGGILFFLFTILIAVDARYWKAGRVFDLRFLVDPPDFPPTSSIPRCYHKSAEQYEGTDKLLVRVEAKQAISFREIELQFVARRWRWHLFPPFRSWTWENAPTSVIEINRATEIHSALYSMSEEPRVHERSNRAGGSKMVYNRPNEFLIDDALWFRIDVKIQGEWHGYLQFRGPSPGGRKSYSRRKVETQMPMKQESDTEDSPSPTDE